MPWPWQKKKKKKKYVKFSEDRHERVGEIVHTSNALSIHFYNIGAQND